MKGEDNHMLVRIFFFSSSRTCMRHFILSPGAMMTVVMTPATMPALKCCCRLSVGKVRREGEREGGRKEREGEGERREGGRV